MKLSGCILILLFPLISFSQTLSPESIFSATDNHKEIGYAQISWTLGDCQIRTFKSDNAVITSGFLQSRITITGIEDFMNNENYSIKVFPNPVKDILNIELNQNRQNKIIFKLYSTEGKLLNSKIIESEDKQIELDFTGYNSGLYFLKASTSDNSLIKTFRIFVQN
jgi:hypothetical protein